MQLSQAGHEQARWPDAGASPPLGRCRPIAIAPAVTAETLESRRRRRGRPAEVGSPRHPVPRVPVRPHGGQHRHRAPGVRRDPRPLRPDQRRQPRLADHHVVLHRRRARAPVLRTVLRSLRTRTGPARGDGRVCTRRTGRHTRAVDDRPARVPLRVGARAPRVRRAAGGDRPRPLRGEPDGARDVGRHGGVPHRAGDRTDDR